MSTIDEQIDKLTRRKKRARTFAEKQRIDVEIARLKAQKSRRREIPKNMKFGGPQDQFQILNKNMQPPLPREKPFERLPFEERQRIRRQNVSAMTPEEIAASQKRIEQKRKEINKDTTFNKNEIFKGKGTDRDRLEQNILDVSENQGLGGTMPTDAEMNVIEKLVSKIVGRRVRFEDIPDDDPDFKQGDGSIEYPAGRPDLRMGGMTARSGATTKFKKPLGMRGGGGISKSQRQRIARLMQEYKQKKARRSNGKRTNR